MKCTAVFTYVSNGNGVNTKTRTAGWTESIYCQTDEIALVQSNFEYVCQKRAILLPKFSAIIGQRYQVVNPAGPASLFDTHFPGSANQIADIPQMALWVKLTGSGVRNARGYKVKAIPDLQVKYGEYQPESAFAAAVTVWRNSLLGKNFAFRGRDLSEITYPIMSIGPALTDWFVELEGNNPFVIGDMVRILRTTNTAGRKVGGRFRVKALGGTNTFIIGNWTGGVCEKGTVRRDAIIYPMISSATAVRITTGKVGRPLDGYVGRRSKQV